MTPALLIYIAGPYRAPTAWRREENIHRARWWGVQVARAGAYPVIRRGRPRRRGGVASAGVVRDDGAVGLHVHGDGTIKWGIGYFDDLAHSLRTRAALRVEDGRWRTYLAIVQRRRRAAKRSA